MVEEMVFDGEDHIKLGLASFSQPSRDSEKACHFCLGKASVIMSQK